jgi:uncharacterized protein YyaL (SSP411 family)
MNRLADETSPYLLQHKNNPVHWYAWSDEAWKSARAENKLVLISIGYSACHWCHVMEKEVFEDYECAELMNMHFICIKVDREERPDVDSWYMDAVHLMGNQGGWPLNVFAMPDGKPIFGGTYFPKHRWIEVLESLNQAMMHDVARVNEYANKLQSALHALNAAGKQSGAIASVNQVHSWIESWSKYWDGELGGNRKAPKFPMPNNWELLLCYAAHFKHELAEKQVKLTLSKMALGGIYDQLAGGFARYSVDAEWKEPHFEKMLYDNAQLISLYAHAYRAYNDDLYLHVVNQSIDFIEDNWKTHQGLYYSALDADSDGVEGKYYVWKEEDFDRLLGADSDAMKRYYGIGTHGYWEQDVSVLCMKSKIDDWCRSENLDQNEWIVKLKRCNDILYADRLLRSKPGTDDKCIASWNAMLLKAFADASKLQEHSHLISRAELLANAIMDVLQQQNGLLAHAYTKQKRSNVCLLEDQIFFIDGLLSLYEVSGNERWIRKANELMLLTEKYFAHESVAMFLNRPIDFQDAGGSKYEVNDNVIPAANSVACRCLLKLSRHMGNADMYNRASRMLDEMSSAIDFAPGFSNWILALLEFSLTPVEVVFAGSKALENVRKFQEVFRPFILIAASTSDSELPLFRERGGDNSPIYVCRNQSCDIPVYTIEDIRI